jgi:PAS domain S-box-containing protein
LNESPPGSQASGPRAELWHTGAPAVFKGDKSFHRAALYFFLFLVLFVGAFGPGELTWSLGQPLHGVLETLATVLAFVVGALSLVRFYSKKQQTFLYIGTGFLGAAVLDTFHALVSTGLVGDPLSEHYQQLASLSFTAGGAILSLFMLLSWVAWQGTLRGSGGGRPREWPVYLSAALLTSLVFVAFAFLPWDRAMDPSRALSQPAGIVPALVFSLALAGYLWKGHWRFDAFEHWLVAALVISVMAHGAYMPFSHRSHDLSFTAAHLLKALGYVGVLIGLMGSVYATFRREEETAEAAQAANAALAREIDIRRQAERAIQESEERLQDFLDSAHDLIQSVSPDGRFLYTNVAWKKVLGYSDEDLERLTFFDVLDASCAERCRQDFVSLLEGQTLPAVKVSFKAADGRVVRCAGSSNARLQDGKPVAVRSVLRDVTEQLQARRELEAFKANLEALVENTGDAIWSVDRSGRLITFNTGFSMAVEVRTGREPWVGAEVDQCFPPEDVAWYEEMYKRSIRGEAFSELRDEEIGGQIRSYEFSFNPIREAMGITGVAVFGRDVTLRRRTQLALRMAKEEAERANQAKSQFLANMSHELRTPLNSVIGFTNILLKNRSGDLAEQEIGFLQRITANGQHLLALINEVLDLAKIEAGRMEVSRNPVDLGALVGETLAQMEDQIKARKLVLKGEVPPDVDPLTTDSSKLRQVIINLVGNALKFTEEGEVVVGVTTRGDGRTPAAIWVRDTGIGIPAERLHAIFEAFQQADGTTSRKYGGTGLGLTISRSLCQLLGFDLKVESEVGKGSTFTILLSEERLSRRRPEDDLMEETFGPKEPARPRTSDRSVSSPERKGTTGR